MRLKASANTSVSTWPASLRRARLFATRPPIDFPEKDDSVTIMAQIEPFFTACLHAFP